MSAFPYLNRSVRDLAWACFSPALLQLPLTADGGGAVTGCKLALTPQRLAWLAQLDRQPQPLLAHLARSQSHRLGIYFEQLWHFFLAQDAAVELVAHNLPVRDDGRTLGEFDIIYWCHQRQCHVHLELAVKFFLGWRQQTTTEAMSHWHEWLGPNSNDRLDLKMAQLLQRQICLGEQPSAQTPLADLGITQMAREVAIRGCLFQPHSDPLPAPRGFNPQLVLSSWLPLGSLDAALQVTQAEQFLLVPKMQWLTPTQPRERDEVMSRATLVERLQSVPSASRRARLVAAIGCDGQELCRFFVTPNDWPAIQTTNSSGR